MTCPSRRASSAPGLGLFRLGSIEPDVVEGSAAQPCGWEMLRTRCTQLEHTRTRRRTRGNGRLQAQPPHHTPTRPTEPGPQRRDVVRQRRSRERPELRRAILQPAASPGPSRLCRARVGYHSRRTRGTRSCCRRTSRPRVHRSSPRRRPARTCTPAALYVPRRQSRPVPVLVLAAHCHGIAAPWVPHRHRMAPAPATPECRLRRNAALDDLTASSPARWLSFTASPNRSVDHDTPTCRMQSFLCPTT